MKNKIALATSLSLITLFANSAFATSPDFQNKGNWYGQIKGLYSKPSNVNFGETLAGIGGGKEGNVGKYVARRAEYNPGVDLSLGYFIRNSDDISLNFAYIHHVTSHSSTSSLVPDEDDHAAYYNYEKVNFVDRYTSLVLRLGHFYSADAFNTHMYMGLDYSSIKQIATVKATYPAAFYEADDTLQPINHRQTESLDGIGPQVGLDTTYALRDHFTLNAGANMSVLGAKVSVKSLDTHSYIPLSSRYNPVENNYNAAFKAHANMGLGYHVLINPSYLLDLELGYEGLYIRSGELASSFSMQGPYLSFNLHGAS